MGINQLLEFVNKKIEELKKVEKQKSQEIIELQAQQNVLITIKDDPFSIYNTSSEEIAVILNIIGLDESNIIEIEKNKIICTAYSKFGKDTIPQIALVEEYNNKLQKVLDTKIKELSKQLKKGEQRSFESIKYEVLQEELLDLNKPISKITLINQLLDENSVSLIDKIKLKLEINEKNKTIYQKKNLSEPSITDKLADEYKAIEDKLTQRFSAETLMQIDNISNCLYEYKTLEQLEDFFEQWQYTFVDENMEDIIDGVIAFKNKEKILAKQVYADDEQIYNENIEAIDSQLLLLKEYKEFLNKEDEEIVDNDSSLTSFSIAVNNYKNNPLDTPNTVLYLSNALDKDIDSVAEKETLEDVFILIEKLRNNENNADLRNFGHRLNCIGTVKDVIVLKPRSKSKQARVAVVCLEDNVFGIIDIRAKKDNEPTSWINTLELRRRNCEIDKLKRTIKNPEVLSAYVEKTIDLSGKLYNKVTASYGSKSSSLSETKK